MFKQVRKYLVILSVLLLISMAILFIFDKREWAETVGAKAFALAILLLVSYLPRIVRRGYI